METILRCHSIITPFAVIPNGCIRWNEKGIIAFSGPQDATPQESAQVIETDALTAIPGMIDMHVHGGFGITFGLGELADGLDTYSLQAAKHGVTGFILTISGPDADFITETIAAYVPLLEKPFSGA